MESNTWAPPNPENRVAKGAMYEKNGKTVVDFRSENGKFMSKEDVKNLSAGTPDGELTPDQWVDREVGRDQGPIDPDATAAVDAMVNGEFPPPLPGSMQQEGSPNEPASSEVPGQVGAVKIPVKDGESEGSWGSDPDAINNIPYDQENEPLDPNEPVKWKEDIEAEKASKPFDWENDPDLANKPENTGGNVPYDQDRELPPPEPGSMIYEGGPDGPIIPGQTPENPGGGETPPEIPEIPGVDGTTPVEGEVPEIPDVVDPDEAESETAKAERQQLEEHELLEMLDLPERTAGELYATRKVYAEMMARRRSGKFNASELEDARKAYVQACNEATAFVLGHLQGKGITDKERLRDLSRLGAEQEIIKTAQLTREFEGEQKEKVGKLRGKLYDFWERNDTGYVGRDRTGLSRWGRFKASVADMAGSFKHSMSTAENIKKTLKKTALMAAMGTAIGFPLGAAGVALLGPGLAAGLSAAAAKGISRGGVAGGLSRGANANSLAQASYDRTIGSMNQMFQDEFMADTGPNGIYGGTKIAEVSRAETKKVVSANRRRIGKAATVGAIFGSAGAFAGDALLGGGGGGGNTPEQPTGGGNGPTPETPGAGGATPETPDGGDGIPEVSVPDPNDITEGQFNTPWSWAAEQYGENNAMARLHELSDRAAAAGHQVEWHNVADGNGTNDWVEIDGVSNTADVVNILNNFQQ